MSCAWRSLHELVPLSLARDGVAITSAGLAGVIGEARHVQLTGPPGCGKSHLVRHTLLGLDTTMLPVQVEGGMYEGQLSALIERSTARFTSGSSRELLSAAAITGQAALLIIDGYNECPDPLKGQAHRRPHGAVVSYSGSRTLIAAHTGVDLPSG